MIVTKDIHQLFNVLFIGRFQFQRNRRRPHADAVLAPFMSNGKDVGTRIGNNRQELDQFAGHVGNDGLEENLALRANQALIDDPGHVVDIDVAAADQGCDLLIADAGNLAVHEGCNRYGTGPFGNGLASFEEDQDGTGDFRFIDGDDFIDIFLTDGEGQIAGHLDGNPIG